jgi:hypothetical protein
LRSIRWQQLAQADIQYAAVVAIVVTLPRLMIPFGSSPATVRETKKPADHLTPAFVAFEKTQLSLVRTSLTPLASRSSASCPFTEFDRIEEAAATAASAAAARTSAIA